MFSFRDDYSEGCHPEILEALSRTAREQQDPYGDDAYSARAKTLIKDKLKNETSEVFFVGSGTMANLLMIAATLKPFEAALSVAGGHIAAHETGAIERAGHKVIEIPSADGKLLPEAVRSAVDHNTMAPHMARPRIVYISNATETGLAYTKAELAALRALCDELDLLLMMDGARLGVAMASDHSDLTWPDLARLTDMFWIGGTKAGALFGEAIVFNRAELARDFAFHIKQRGAMFSKGRALGLQFITLFEDDLYMAASRRANVLAARLAEGIQKAGHSLTAAPQTNQLFPVLPTKLVERLERNYAFHRWSTPAKDKSEIRLVTSWATPEDQVEAFIGAISSF